MSRGIHVKNLWYMIGQILWRTKYYRSLWVFCFFLYIFCFFLYFLFSWSMNRIHKKTKQLFRDPVWSLFFKKKVYTFPRHSVAPALLASSPLICNSNLKYKGYFEKKNHFSFHKSNNHQDHIQYSKDVMTKWCF